MTRIERVVKEVSDLRDSYLTFQRERRREESLVEEAGEGRQIEKWIAPLCRRS